MHSLDEIRFVPHGELDFDKWDTCIQQAPNGLVYGYSVYLNYMARHWDALVLGNYEYVMPLTWNRKYGIHYLYQPFLTAQLGLFGPDVNSSLLEAFLLAIPSRFSYWDFYLNHGNLFKLEKFPLYERRNFILHLNTPYENLQAGFRENIRRNIRKARQLGCRPVVDFDVRKVIELAAQQMKSFAREIPGSWERFVNLYLHLHVKKQAITYGIQDAAGNLVASCVFVFSHNRAFYVLVGNHPNGRTIGASHYLLDAFIRDHAGKELILDFEGSDLRNLAFFYSSFGAREESYSAIRLNRLPFFLKWLKK